MSLIARHFGVMCLAFVGLVLVWSGLQPKDRFTWFLEVAPVLLIAPFAVRLHLKYEITSLLIGLMALHGVVLCIGGKYTYAEVPAGFWIQDLLGLARNHYDRLGHWMQGFVPAILAREVLLRNDVLRKKGLWLGLIVSSLCLAFSACYELIEWLTATLSGEAADAFLGTQGDVWDTQWDMFMALLGSIAAQVSLVRVHDNFLVKTNLLHRQG
ncbi:MAG: DUF2238 domain-containing protein [Proteobacteria bacterium]|nr:DUF2238 domain-containing protein [Pseudomonadota bacterium]